MKGGADCPPIAGEVLIDGYLCFASMKGGRTAPR